MEVWVITNIWSQFGIYNVATYLYSSKEEAQKNFDRMVKNSKEAHASAIRTHVYEVEDDKDYLFRVCHFKDRTKFYEEFYLTERIVE